MNATIDFSEVLSLKSLKVLGYTTDFNQCDCCGRESLKGTVSILDTRYDVVLHYGTGCAAAANKYDTLDTLNEVKKMIKEEMKKYNTAEKLAAKMTLDCNIQKAKNEFKAAPEKIAYDKHMIDREPLLEAAYNDYAEHSKIVEETFRLGRICDLVKKGIMVKYSIPFENSYKI
ncbi:MAG: hypothetical protein K0Q79_2760 [Flavipsychrobacter sp.]|jgi:hypothetical protein|nr:hypothetical protein [Flavipsychrobacter sp.]